MTVDKLYELSLDADSNTLLDIRDYFTHDLLSLATWCQTPCRLLRKKVQALSIPNGNYKAGHAPRIEIWVINYKEDSDNA